MNKPLILLFLPFTLLWSAVIWYFLATGEPENREINFYSNHPVIDRIFFDGDVALAKDAFYAIEESPFSVQTRQSAYRDIQRAYQQDPDDPWVAIAASRLQMEMAYRSGNRHLSNSYHQEMLADARRQAEQAVQYGSEVSIAYSQLARIQIITGDPRTAWHTLNDAHRLDPDSFYPWYLRSVIAVQMQDPDRAHAAFEEAERRAGRQFQQRILLQEQNNLARQADDLEARDRLYRAIIDLDPNNAHSHGNYGAFLLGQQRYDEAIRYLENAVEISPYPLAEEQLQRARAAGE